MCGFEGAMVGMLDGVQKGRGIIVIRITHTVVGRPASPESGLAARKNFSLANRTNATIFCQPRINAFAMISYLISKESRKLY